MSLTNRKVKKRDLGHKRKKERMMENSDGFG